MPKVLPKRIVITGGPGSGKTALASFLEKRGQRVLHEISREIIIESRNTGSEQPFLENPLRFSELLFEKRSAQFRTAEAFDCRFLFYDRGLPDIIAYLDFLNIKYAAAFGKKCSEKKYDAVFLLPPWEEIYVRDTERYESFAEAKTIFEKLKSVYETHCAHVFELPKGALETRHDFLLNKLHSIF